MAAIRARVLDGPPPGWNELLHTDPNATPAHRPEVWWTLADHLPRAILHFVAVERDGVLIGGTPALCERRGGFHWIHALPSVLSGAPLARAGEHARVDALVAEALAGLQRSLRAVGGEWVLFRPRGPDFATAALESPGGTTGFVETALLEFDGGLEPTWRRVDQHVRSELRQARAHGFRFAEEPEALEEVYALYLLQARRWPGYRPQPLELSRRLLAPRAGDPAARLFTVRDERRLAAAILVLDHPRESFAWWSGARPGARAQHATPFLFWSLAQWAADAGRLRLNLGGSLGRPGLAAFKRSLGARFHRYPIRWLDARHAGVAGRWIAALQGRIRRGRFRGETA